MKKTTKIIIAAIALVLVAGIMLGVYFATRPQPEEGSKSITVTVVHKDGSEKDFPVKTDAEYLAQVLVLLNRLALQNRKEEPVTAPDSTVYNVLGYINDHYHENLTLDDLANRFFISKYHLSREFQRLVGSSVHRYIVQKRLVMAKQMLSNGKPSSEVYQSCGFGDYSNFYRAFKAEYQISPKEYVLRLKESAYREDPIPRSLREWQ